MSRQSDAGRTIPFLDKSLPGNDDSNASLEASDLRSQSLVAAAAEGVTNSILPGVFRANVTGVTADANDFVVLPAIADVPLGHEIMILANAGANFELRTPASSNTKINDVDSDGSQEYLVTDTHTVRVHKRTTTGWSAVSITKLGAIATAVIPD